MKVEFEKREKQPSQFGDLEIGETFTTKLSLNKTIFMKIYRNGEANSVAIYGHSTGSGYLFGDKDKILKVELSAKAKIIGVW